MDYETAVRYHEDGPEVMFKAVISAVQEYEMSDILIASSLFMIVGTFSTTSNSVKRAMVHCAKKFLEEHDV